MWFSYVYASWIFVLALFDCSFDFASAPTQVLSLLVGSTCPCPHSPERRSNQPNEITCVGLQRKGNLLFVLLHFLFIISFIGDAAVEAFSSFYLAHFPWRGQILFFLQDRRLMSEQIRLYSFCYTSITQLLLFMKWVMHADPWTLYSLCLLKQGMWGI